MRKSFKRVAVSTGLMLSLALAQMATETATAAVPEVNIAPGPLYSGSGNVHPNMLLNLSVEFPTVGAAYRGVSDYDKTKAYLGYFNPAKCYTYPTSVAGAKVVSITTGATVNNSRPVPYRTTTTTSTSGGVSTIVATVDTVTTVAGKDAVPAIPGDPTIPAVPAIPTTYNHTPTITTSTTSAIPNPDLTDAGYFSILKAADANHECGGDSFSGNFMNWASSSSIDMLRYAMTGGDRIIDTLDTTVLQRAYLRDVDGTFYASSTYFPRKSVDGSSSSSAPRQVTPFDTPMLYVVSCRNRILFSTTAGNAKDGSGKSIASDCDTKRSGGGSPDTLWTTDKYFGEYQTRVRVCDSNEGPDRRDNPNWPNFCQKYGSNYKPEGDLQRKSDKLRVGVLGYLTQYGAGSDIYGGVVRGRIKYVGPKKFDAPAFSESANDKPEWSATTGVFYNNPEDASNRDASDNSGVINYLNKFGRTNPSSLGRYKGYDPIGELYYESIRYLQGRQPTAEALTALGTATTDDNFPVLKTWTDPVTASCQNNYAVTIGDVNTHYDRYIPGNSRAMSTDKARDADVADAKWPALNVMSQSKLVGDMEADASGDFGNSAKRSNLANLDTMDTGSGGHGTYYMAGLAYWAHVNDIRKDKPVRVNTFSIDVDEGGNGKIDDSNARGTKPRDSQLYLAAKYGGFLDRNKDGNPFKTTVGNDPTVVNNNSEWSSNGTDPDNYFLASDPVKMVNAIHNIFKEVARNSGTISGVTLTSTRVSSDSSYVYQPGFDPSKWSGSLLKLELKLVDTAPGNPSDPGHVANNVVKIQDPKSPTWDAGLVLTGKPASTTSGGSTIPAVAPLPTPDDRAIYTAKVAADGSLITVPFTWTSGLSATQQDLLNVSPVTGTSDGLGQQRVNYLRGGRGDEIGQANGVFRQRDRVLGDIVNSNPTYVGAPAAGVQGKDYKTFYDDHANRAKAVFIGANDGMLHAFAASDGTELFAYVPNALIGSMNRLTDPNYVHQPYVDGTMTVTEALVGSSWKTILMSGMGGGAQGAFVLDVTNPADFAGGSGAIWEFTDKDDADMGNLTSPPLVAKFRSGGTAAAPTYKYFVVIPSGLNNYKDDAGYKDASGNSACNPASTTCDATAPGALFLLSLDKDPKDAWSLGTNYYKFKTPLKDSTLQNGLGSPALVTGSDGAVRYSYAGDLQGNLWRFDFTGDAPWSNALPISGTPLFTAKDGNGARQPITEQPKVVFAPGGGYVVLFGTGKFVENADAAAGNFKTQSFYGIYDTTYNKDAVTGRGQLAKRTVAADTAAGSDAVTVTGDDFDYGVSSPAFKGWYFDFLNSATTGERSVTNALVAYGKLFMNSLVTGSDPCAKGGGRTYALDALTGLPINGDGVGVSGGVTGQVSTVGMLSSPVLFETGTTVGDRDSIGKRVAKKTYSVFNFGTGGSAGTASAATNGTGSFQPPAGRNSWREVLNYQELRDAANK